MEEQPTVADCLAEITRLRAENARLNSLSRSKRPELAELRALEVAIRDYANNWPAALERLQVRAQNLIATWDDLPKLMELSGILSEGRERVYAALESQQAAPAVGQRSENPT